MDYTVYILKSLKDNKFYYGYTSNIELRFKQHNNGEVNSTRSRRPFILHYCEIVNSKTLAIKRENFFKSYNGYKWLKSTNII